MASIHAEVPNDVNIETSHEIIDRVEREALEQLDKYNFTKGFFGTNGIDLKRGFTTPDQKEAAVKKKAMEQCQKTYILSDASKFNCDLN